MRLITISGNVGTEPQIKEYKNGRYIKFRFANSDKINTKTSSGKPSTYWYDVISFDNNIIDKVKIKRGNKLIITGNYNDSIYLSKNKTPLINREIIAKNIEFINNKC